MEKAVIYQIFTRVGCNSGGRNVPGGDIHTNGSGKLELILPPSLRTSGRWELLIYGSPV